MLSKRKRVRLTAFTTFSLERGDKEKVVRRPLICGIAQVYDNVRNALRIQALIKNLCGESQ